MPKNKGYGTSTATKRQGRQKIMNEAMTKAAEGMKVKKKKPVKTRSMVRKLVRKSTQIGNQ